MKLWHKDYTHLIVRILIGLLFLYAGAGKIADPFGFAVDIYNYKLFPEPVIGFIAAFIPWLELVAGVCLILGVGVRGASLVISGLLFSFIVLIGISWIRGLDVECGCFSGIERSVGFMAIGEDMLMLAGAMFVLVFDRMRILPYKLGFSLKRR